MIKIVDEKTDFRKRKIVSCPRCECMFGIDVEDVLNTTGYIHIDDLWELWNQIRIAMTENQISHVRYNQIINKLNKILNVTKKPSPT